MRRYASESKIAGGHEHRAVYEAVVRLQQLVLPNGQTGKETTNCLLLVTAAVSR